MQNGNNNQIMTAHQEKSMRQNAYIIWAVMGFICPALLVAALWKINTTGGQVVNFLSHDAWIPKNLDEERMVFIMPLYVLSVICLITEFVLPNLIAKAAAQATPRTAMTKTGALNSGFLRLILRMAGLGMTVTIGFAAALVLKQAELIIPFVIISMVASSVSSPTSFFEET